MNKFHYLLYAKLFGGGSGGSGGSGDEPGDIGAEKYIEAQHADVVLPNATAIKPRVFYGDKVLTNISMPNVKIIGEYAFNSCHNLALTNLPDGLEKIEQQAFSYCYALNLTILPESLRRLDSYVFKDCVNLKTITFKCTYGTINSSAFNGCNNITVINVPWAEGEVSGAPWGATNATVNYNYTEG